MPNLIPLTSDEIAGLEGQYDRIRALLAHIDAALTDNGITLATALAEFGQARIAVDIAKNEKSMLVERARNLKTLLAGY